MRQTTKSISPLADVPAASASHQNNHNQRSEFTSPPPDKESTLPQPAKNIAFLSSCTEVWGGSEELWGGAARTLACAGHKVTACKMGVDLNNARVKEVLGNHVLLRDFWDVSNPRLLRYVNRLLPARWQFLPYDIWTKHLRAALQALRPDLVVISQGENFDGLNFVKICQHLRLLYALICQKASDHTWPSDEIRPEMRRAYREAERAYFVSHHNQELTEEQMGARLTNAEVVCNPFQASFAAPLPWLQERTGRVRLACIARANVHDKGQDALLRVLAQRKWKTRPLEVTFHGKGSHDEGLKEMAALLDVTGVHFAGFTQDISAVWQNHHALLLPSRAEGLPLVLVEAMLCGRPAILTRAGGTAEIVDDGVTGFLASDFGVNALDSVLERAWERRDEWEQMGQQAARHIRQMVPPDPCATFVDKLLQLGCLRG